MAGKRVPWECDSVDGKAELNQERLAKLEEAKEKVLNGTYSLREAADWLTKETGHSLSHAGLRTKFTPVQRAQLSSGGHRPLKERRKAQKEGTRLGGKKSVQTARKKRRERIKKEDKEKKLVQELTKEKKKTKVGKILEQEVFEDLHEAAKQQLEEEVIFRPNPGPQEDFLAAPETDVLYGGAAGGGKSYSLVVDPLRYAHNKNHRALLLRKTLKELRELIMVSRELYPKAFPGARYKETEKVWVFPSGATLEFGYLEKEGDVYQYQGQAFTWIGFDEITHLPTEFAWTYLGSRLRSTDPTIELSMRCTANPGGVGHKWVKERYVDPAEWGTSFKGKDGITRKFIPARLEDNPHLYSDGRYEQMLKSLDEVSRRRLLEGDWFVNDGVAFPEFHRDTHVIEPFTIPPHWNRFKGVDYGYAAPSAALWFAVDPSDGTIICYRELYERGLTGDDLAQAMIEREAEEHRSIPGVLDTAAWNRTGYSGPTIGETLNRAGLKLRPADKNRIAGKVQVHERMKVRDNGRPGIQFFKTCYNVIREIESLPLSPKNHEDVDTTAEDHAYDALRYAVMSRPRVETFDDWATRAKEREMYRPASTRFGY